MHQDPRDAFPLELDAARQELQELLLELSHDLGKYLRLPLAMLPADAGDADLREALRRALHETRKSPRGVRDARTLFAAFVAELPERQRHTAQFATLESALGRALAWEQALDDVARPLPRAAVLSDLSAVAAAISAWLVHLQGEGS